MDKVGILMAVVAWPPIHLIASFQDVQLHPDGSLTVIERGTNEEWKAGKDQWVVYELLEPALYSRAVSQLLGNWTVRQSENNLRTKSENNLRTD